MADVLYFYGENVPSFVRLKGDDPAEVLPGYDYDVINAEALVERTSVRDGQIVLPEGTAYRVLVLPEGDRYSLAALEKVAALVRPAPRSLAPSRRGPSVLSGDPADEKKFRELADTALDGERGQAVRRSDDIPAREALSGAGIEPDFTATNSSNDVPEIDFIHRRTTDADIYFVCNRLDRWQDARCSFRIAGKQPELWDRGERRDSRRRGVPARGRADGRAAAISAGRIDVRRVPPRDFAVGARLGGVQRTDGPLPVMEVAVPGR